MVALPFLQDMASESGNRAPRAKRLFMAPMMGVVVMSVLRLGTGASGVAVGDLILNLLRGDDVAMRDRVVLFDIRLPRLTMGLLVGAALAVSAGADQVTLPPTFIQRERDSGFEFCLFGRVGQRGLARSFAGCAASGPVAGRRSGRTRLGSVSRGASEVVRCCSHGAKRPA